MSNTKSNIQGINILLVEDDAFNQRFMKRLIEGLGAVVNCVNNGKEAVAFLSEKMAEVDVVFMDLDMPIMGGVDAVQLIRTDLKLTIPIIALTGNQQTEEKEKALQSGFNDYLIKPCNSKDLLNAVVNLLNLDSFITTPINKNTSSAISSDENLFSLHKLEEISRGNKAFVTKMVGMLLEEMPQSLKLLNEHVVNKEYDRLRAIAHKMKPSINLMAMTSIYEVIQQVEDFAGSETNSVQLPLLVEQITNACEEMLAQLAKV